MDDGRVSYKEAVEAIRQFGYLGIERNEDVVWHFNNGDCTLDEARAWCLVNNYPQSELSRRNEDWHSSPAMRHQKKEPWPYRLVAFLNEVIDMILNDILEDFV